LSTIQNQVKDRRYKTKAKDSWPKPTVLLLIANAKSKQFSLFAKA